MVVPTRQGGVVGSGIVVSPNEEHGGVLPPGAGQGSVQGGGGGRGRNQGGDRVAGIDVAQCGSGQTGKGGEATCGTGPLEATPGIFNRKAVTVG